MPNGKQTIHVKVNATKSSVTVTPLTAQGSLKAGTVFRWVLDGAGGTFQARLLIPGAAFKAVDGSGGPLPQSRPL